MSSPVGLFHIAVEAAGRESGVHLEGRCEHHIRQGQRGTAINVYRLRNYGAEVCQENLEGVLLRRMGLVIARPVLGIGTPGSGIYTWGIRAVCQPVSHGKGTILSAIRGRRCYSIVLSRLNTIIAYGIEKVKLVLSRIVQFSGQLRRISSRDMSVRCIAFLFHRMAFCSTG